MLLLWIFAAVPLLSKLRDLQLVYASNLVTLARKSREDCKSEQNTKVGKSYDVLNKVQHAMSVHVPNIISIWIINNNVTHGVMKNRKSPVEEISCCVIPNNFEDKYDKFNNKIRIIWVQLAKFRNKLVKDSNRR